MSRWSSPVIVRVVSTSCQALERYEETVFPCKQSDTLLYMFGDLRLEYRVPISCLLLPHAAAPDTEGTARTELNATLGEIDKDSLNLGLPRFNVFISRDGAATRVFTSTAVHCHRASWRNALEVLMARSLRAYFRVSCESEQKVATWLNPKQQRCQLGRALYVHLAEMNAGFNPSRPPALMVAALFTLYGHRHSDLTQHIYIQ